MSKVNRERLEKTIGRKGSEISSSQDNEITRYIEKNTSEGVVPRDYHTQSAVHFIDEDDKRELLSEIRKAKFNTKTNEFGCRDGYIAGSGVIVKADNDSVRTML
jgi:hypothetical protein